MERRYTKLLLDATKAVIHFWVNDEVEISKEVEESEKSSIIELSLLQQLEDSKLIYNIKDLFHAIDVLQRRIGQFIKYTKDYPRIFRSARIAFVLVNKLFLDNRLDVIGFKK
eukprot:UN13113